jgi:hypothetical protein
MKVRQLFEATNWRDVPQVRVSNIYPGNPRYNDLLALTSKDEIEKVKRKSLLTNVKKRYKGASFVVVGKTNTDDVYFRICKSDIKESKVSEGAFVIKNQDGKEKRFKDTKSDEAKAWASSATPKKRSAEKYTQEWWKAKELRDHDALVPWSPITESDVYPQLEKFVKSNWGATQYDLSSMMGAPSQKLVDGVKCTTRYIRVMVIHFVDHHLGLESDTEESYRIEVSRDPRNPKKLNFSL